MRVVCIDNKYSVGVMYNHLTIGKFYEVISEIAGNYEILTNFNAIHYMKKERFVSLKEYRKMKLNKLESVSNGEVL